MHDRCLLHPFLSEHDAQTGKEQTAVDQIVQHAGPPVPTLPYHVLNQESDTFRESRLDAAFLLQPVPAGLGEPNSAI